MRAVAPLKKKKKKKKKKKRKKKKEQEEEKKKNKKEMMMLINLIRSTFLTNDIYLLMVAFRRFCFPS